MFKKMTGIASLVLLALSAAMIGYVAIFNPYGGHSVAAFVLLAMLLGPLGFLLGIISVVLHLVDRGNRPNR